MVRKLEHKAFQAYRQNILETTDRKQTDDKEKMMRTWIITGASSGIGRGITLEALKRGDNVVITARDTERLQDITGMYPDRAYPMALEITDAAMRKALVAATTERFGRVDVLVNNAGRGYQCPVEDSSEDEIRLLFETNYFGPVGLVQEVLPVMRMQGAGVIANVSSMGVHFPDSVGNAFYTSSKMALDEFSRILRNEVKPFGVEVMVIEPGTFRTNFRLAGVSPKAERNQAYLATAYASADYLKANPHNQQGDPGKAGKVIVDAVCADVVPKYLVLGGGMVEAEISALQARIDEVRKCAEIAPTTDYTD